MENSTFSVKRYTAEDKFLWHQFMETSKNATFLFQRDFMEYHADRFTDHSLLVLKKGKPVALLPANIADNTLYSHQGLTYGGLILHKKVKLKEVAAIFSSVLQFLNEKV